MSLVLGLDSSTQSLSAVILDTEKGIVVADDSVNFGKDLPQYGQPHGYDESGARGRVHSNPLMWLEALDLLLSRMTKNGVDFSNFQNSFTIIPTEVVFEKMSFHYSKIKKYLNT